MHFKGYIYQLFLPLFIITASVLSGCATSSSAQQTMAPEQLNGTPENRIVPNDQGMWLLPQIDGILYKALKNKGLKLAKSTLYHPEKASLNQGIVRININGSSSGTGAFVSPKGLILTNHRIAYDGKTSASIIKNNYPKTGFYADAMDSELPLENYTLYIPIEQKEVTHQIQSQLPDTLTYYEQQQQTQSIKKRLIAQRKDSTDDLIVEINDFWSGNRQFMSVYKVIQDVRLVHLPPKAVAEYTNAPLAWSWPTHGGDYAFLRAYVDTNGQGSSYDDANIPFQPATHLPIDTSGVAADDFTMTLGFPGQTYRNESSFSFEFYKNHRNPVLLDSYRAILKSLQYADEQDSGTAIKNTSRRASIANVLAYYRDVQHGFEKHNIIEKKRTLEKDFEMWARKDSLRFLRYRRVLKQLDQAYDIASQSGDLLYGLVQAINNNKLLKIAGFYNAYRRHRGDSANTDLTQKQKKNLITQHKKVLENINIEAQKLMLSEMLYSQATLPDGKVMFYLIRLFGGAEKQDLKQEITNYVDSLEQQSFIFDLTKAKKFVDLPIDSARATPADPMVELYKKMFETYQFSRKNYLQHVPYLRPAQRRYAEGMLAFKNDTLSYPDANSTLRLSTGHVTGYKNTEGTYHNPFTTPSELAANSTKSAALNKYIQLSTYADSVDSPVINFLTSNDITGGNSGSPVLNKDGEIVGLAIGSNPKGVIGDYHYNRKFKRAINVDIRYILFLLKEISGDDRLLKEIQISSTIQKSTTHK
ncbi:S46 family peptidase [Fodinibius halophilus]|uniref:Dipeptidyl-peptidase n=1 Tax=Fodinibius halophilus TaxID=1736908 RepID=A0A6M1SXN7_9BACT|nr:S46 family peptidase [Fodinibius halophilus]NGP88668.1 S46 family peptidase [Fodinibius halophilus]